MLLPVQACAFLDRLLLSPPIALEFLTCQVLTAFGFLVLLRRDSLVVDILSSVWPRKWRTGTILFALSKMREVTFALLFSRLCTSPGFFGILYLVASPLVCRRLLLWCFSLCSKTVVGSFSFWPVWLDG